MSLVINHNMMAAHTARNLNQHYGRLNTSTERLATGLRINSAADDAAGLAIRELMRTDIAALHQGARNVNDAVSLIQTADGALGIIDEKLIRMKELAEQSATGTYDSTQRLMIDSEYQAMASEITRIANATNFNGIHLLNGNLSGEHDGSGLISRGQLKVHFGTGNDSAEDYYYIRIGNCTASTLGVGNAAIAQPRITVLTSDYYVELRDASANETYLDTYTEKYNQFYREIHDKLTAGTPPNPGIPPEQASAIAATQANREATMYASQDESMVKAIMDKVYDDAFAAPYERAYNEAIAQGQSHAQADALGQKAGTEAAINEVLARAEQVKADNSTASLLAPPNDLMPPRNSEGAEAFIKQVGMQAYDATYREIYNSLYADATTKANQQLAAGTVLNPTQVLAIHNACHTQAANQAEVIGRQIEGGMRSQYESTYAGLTPANGFQKYYDDAIAAGDPAVVARNKAEARASSEAWTAMVNAMNAAARNGTGFGLRPPDPQGGDRLVVHEDQLDASITVAIPGLRAVQAVNTGAPGDVTKIYRETGTGSKEYLETDHGILADDHQGVVNSLADYIRRFNADTKAGGPADGASIETQEKAQKALVAIDEAIVSKDKIRANLGAVQNRLENTVTNLNIQAENLQNAESRISDVDTATEMTQFVRNQIMSQAAVAMLAQANSLPQMAMQLIGG